MLKKPKSHNVSFGVDVLKQSEVPAPHRSRVILVLVFALFALPLAVAWVMNFTTDWVPHATTNHGELIQPVRPFSLTGLLDDEGKALGDEAVQGRWTLLYLQDGECGEACHQAMYILRQVRLAQGKNIDRVTRLMLVNSPQLPAWVSEVQPHYPGMLLAHPATESTAVLSVFPEVNQIYILDPLGNLMMRYPLDTEPRGMIKDLERLLQISYVG